MDLSSKTKMSDDDDDKSDASIVTNTTVDTLNGRSPIMFPSLQRYTTEKEEDPLVFTGTVCSPIIPVLSVSFLTKSLKQASQSSVEEDSEDSNDSYVSESLISIQPQKTKQERNQNHPARLFHKEQTRGIIQEENEQNITREVIQNKKNELRSKDSIGGNIPAIPDSVTDSQETCLSGIESEIHCAKKGEMKEKRKERRKQDKLFTRVMSYEMVAVTNSFLNNEKLNMLDENNGTNKKTMDVEDLPFASCMSAKNSDHSSKSLSGEKNANLFENDVQDQSEQMTCLAAPIQANCESISSPQKLLCIAVSKSENLPPLSEKDISCICIGNTMPNIVKERNKINESQEVTQLCVDDTREITQVPIYDSSDITQLPVEGTGEITQDHQVHVQHERCRTIFSSQNEMETTVNSTEDLLFERAIQNEVSVLKSSKEAIPSSEECLAQPIETISPQQSVGNNCKNNKTYADAFDGSQNLFPDTQSSLGSITKSSGLSSVNLQNIDMKCSDQETANSLLDNKSNTNQTRTIQLSMDSICLSTVAGQHQMLDVEMTQSDSQENPVLSCSQEWNAVSGHYNDQEHHRNQGNVADISEVQSSATQYDGIVTLEDAAYQSKSGPANNVNDMDISSDVEPSQMILIPAQHDAQAMISEERTRSNCLTSSQSLSSSSLSSLGDISEGGVNFKNKEKHILYKIEKMQGKIQKKLVAASKKSSVLDVDVTKQKLQAIKGILIKIAERHKVERNKLSLEVKRSSKSRACKTQIRENLIELSERQKLLYKLFQNHKEISRIIRDDLNKYLATALKLDDEGKSDKRVRQTQQTSENNKTGGMQGKRLKSEKGSNEGFKSKNLISKGLLAVNKEEHTSNSKIVTVTKKVPKVSKIVVSNLMEVVADDRRHDEEVTSSTNGISYMERNSALQKKMVGQENDKNYCISINGTQELYCDREEEMTTADRTVTSQRKTQIECSTITTVGQSSSLMTQTPGFLGTKCNPESDENVLKAMGLFTTQTGPRPAKSKGHVCGIEQDNNGKFITAQQKIKINEGITPHFSEGNCMPISSISTSKAHQRSEFDPKISTEELRQSCQSTICIAAKDSFPVHKGRVLPSSSSIVLPRPSISASKSLMSAPIVLSQLSMSAPKSMTSAPIVLLQPSKSASKSLTHSSMPVLIQKANDTYLSVPVSTSSVVVGNSEKTGSNVTEQDRGTKLPHSQGNAKVVVPTGICMPNNNITVIRIPDCQTNGKLTSSQDKQKRQTCSQPKHKPVHGSQKTSRSRNKATPDDENGMHSQNEVMKKVMEDAMRIINDRTIGNLKRPLTDIENGWQAKQSRLYTADPEMPMNRDIFKSPPLYQVDAARDISPSAASFATFRSTFPEHSPNICTQSQYLPESPAPVGIFYGLKYPPLDMLIEKQILRAGENVLSVNARDKEFKASLTTEGCIESIGGELFQTPVKWLAAILGKPVPDVKKNRAYREVHYRGKPLIAYVEDPTLVPEKDEATPDMKAGHHHSNGKVDQSRQDSLKKLKNMLNNCTIRLLDDKDLVSDNDLPENFWTEDFSKVKLSIDMWKDVDKWD